ncbi:hypothetical protein C8Q72DRAFT_866213 [Fomitopsis betulina]|nr:hypothetical protein C8Q72DRAFT_866213 [Fomitopsis betulina]
MSRPKDSNTTSKPRKSAWLAQSTAPSATNASKPKNSAADPIASDTKGGQKKGKCGQKGKNVPDNNGLDTPVIGNSESVQCKRLKSTDKSVEAGEHGMVQRMLKNRKYLRALSKIPTQCVSNMCRAIKAQTYALVPAHYGFHWFDDEHTLKAVVDWLKEEDMFHYPCDPEVRTCTAAGKPYQHPIIEAMFQSTLFKKSTSFCNAQCLDLFTSSLPDKQDEKELLKALVGLDEQATLRSVAGR